MVAVLPRQPGTKESRYLELMSGDASAASASGSGSASLQAFRQHVENAPPAREMKAGDAPQVGGDGGRVARLEAEVAELRGEVAALKAQFAEFRKQFE